MKPAAFQGGGVFWVGRGVNAGYFAGLLEELRVWRGAAVNRPRLKTFMTLSHDTVTDYHPHKSSLVGYWRLDNFTTGSGDKAALDASVNANHITNWQNGAIKVSGLPTYFVTVPDVQGTLEADEQLVALREMDPGGGPFPRAGGAARRVPCELRLARRCARTGRRVRGLRGHELRRELWWPGVLQVEARRGDQPTTQAERGALEQRGEGGVAHLLRRLVQLHEELVEAAHASDDAALENVGV